MNRLTIQELMLLVGIIAFSLALLSSYTLVGAALLATTNSLATYVLNRAYNFFNQFEKDFFHTWNQIDRIMMNLNDELRKSHLSENLTSITSSLNTLATRVILTPPPGPVPAPLIVARATQGNQGDAVAPPTEENPHAPRHHFN